MKQKYTFINWSQFKWNKTIKHKTNKYLLKSKDNEATGILTSQVSATPKLSESSEPSVGNQLRRLCWLTNGRGRQVQLLFSSSSASVSDVPQIVA